jgi:hypothetical protein
LTHKITAVVHQNQYVLSKRNVTEEEKNTGAVKQEGAPAAGCDVGGKESRKIND